MPKSPWRKLLTAFSGADIETFYRMQAEQYRRQAYSALQRAERAEDQLDRIRRYSYSLL